MVYKKDTTLGQTKEFDAQIQVLDIPNEIKVRVCLSQTEAVGPNKSKGTSAVYVPFAVFCPTLCLKAAGGHS